MTSTVKVNNVQASDGGNIINQCGTNITLGASGDTIALASGATQTGFGRTGTVDWVTTVQTSTITAATGKGYFVNTTGGAITANLPAGAAGSIVSFSDYANTWDTNALTVSPNGSEKIGGVAADATLSTEGQSVTFVYIDSTQGWKNVQDSTSNVTGETFMSASVSGSCNTLTTVDTNYKVAKFVGPGTFTVCSIGNTDSNNTVSYVVVAGGGGSGNNAGGGGGAGGYREVKSTTTGPYTASPLDGYPNAPNRVIVTATGFPIAIGAGGAGSTNANCKGASGSVSTFSTITSAGGGGAGSGSSEPGNPGGSGGGGRANQGASGGTGNTPPTSPSQGTNGGDTAPSPTPAPYLGGGGGGATAAGASGNPGNGAGGAGATTNISGSPLSFAGGGGGGSNGPASQPGGPGGTGGGGTGNTPGTGSGGTPGTVNTGGGGGNNGAGYSPNNGLAGGSGIVYIRYKYQ